MSIQAQGPGGGIIGCSTLFLQGIELSLEQLEKWSVSECWAAAGETWVSVLCSWVPLCTFWSEPVAVNCWDSEFRAAARGAN